MKEWQKKFCIDFDPFEGDFGDEGDHLFKDQVVIGRKSYTCENCGREIIKGEPQRVIVCKSDGELFTHRYCEKCCKLMAYCSKYGMDVYDLATDRFRDD